MFAVFGLWRVCFTVNRIIYTFSRNLPTNTIHDKVYEEKKFNVRLSTHMQNFILRFNSTPGINYLNKLYLRYSV